MILAGGWEYDACFSLVHKLKTLLSSLSERSSKGKAMAVESFYWLLEEYKISVFVQELKTRGKISAKKLDKELMAISTMI